MKKILIAAFAAVISLLPVSTCGSDSNAGQENKEYPVIKFENDQRTTPEYPREPIMPGKTGEIKMTFNGEGYDRFIKSVTLILNTREGREILYITGKLTDKTDKKK